MLRVAITGGIACGKSLVGSFLSAEGIPVREADDIAREMMGQGTPVYREVVKVFGRGIVGPDGEIDRTVLSAEVFSSTEKLKVLNSIVHPAAKKAWEVWLAGQMPGHKAASVIIPLLYEIGDRKNWDAVICVSARQEDRNKWLKERGLTRNEIEARLAAQMPVTEKMQRADYVIFNNGTPELLKQQVVRVLKNKLES